MNGGTVVLLGVRLVASGKLLIDGAEKFAKVVLFNSVRKLAKSPDNDGLLLSPPPLSGLLSTSSVSAGTLILANLANRAT